MIDATRSSADRHIAPVPIWLHYTPTSEDLEHCSLWFFHNAIDELEADTVPEAYWRKVIESQRTRQQTKRHWR